MRKFLLVLIVILTGSFLLAGCSLKLGSYTINNFHVTKEKPSTSFYTDNLVGSVLTDNALKISMLDMNFYKEKELQKEDLDLTKNFFSSLKSSNFIEKPKDLPANPQFKFFVSSSKEKYVINIFDDKYISIHPWDGTYSMDYIDMQGTQPLHNLYGLCKYIMTNSSGL
jgi:hypothetical protein